MRYLKPTCECAGAIGWTQFRPAPAALEFYQSGELIAVEPFGQQYVIRHFADRPAATAPRRAVELALRELVGAGERAFARHA
ncbi:MAG TPA: hypothetical protein VF703_08520 [Pyrinomonadaceae bacterium]